MDYWWYQKGKWMEGTHKSRAWIVVFQLMFIYLPHKCKHIMQDYWDSCGVTCNLLLSIYTTSGRNWNETTITSIQICKIPTIPPLIKSTAGKVKILAPLWIFKITYQNVMQWLLQIGLKVDQTYWTSFSFTTDIG